MTRADDTTKVDQKKATRKESKRENEEKQTSRTHKFATPVQTSGTFGRSRKIEAKAGSVWTYTIMYRYQSLLSVFIAIEMYNFLLM